MILIDAGDRSARMLEARLVLAAQLAARGHAVGLDDATLGAPLGFHQRYQAAPILVAASDVQVTGIIVLASGGVSSATLSGLRGYALPPDAPVTVLGRFATRQDEMDAGLPLAFALGREPAVVNVAGWQKAAVLADSAFPSRAARRCRRRAPTGGWR